jgi:hypothetical protein
MHSHIVIEKLGINTSYAQDTEKAADVTNPRWLLKITFIAAAKPLPSKALGYTDLRLLRL